MSPCTHYRQRSRPGCATYYEYATRLQAYRVGKTLSFACIYTLRHPYMLLITLVSLGHVQRWTHIALLFDQTSVFSGTYPQLRIALATLWFCLAEKIAHPPAHRYYTQTEAHP